MKHFWQGFDKKSAPLQFKKHVIVVFLNPSSSQGSTIQGTVQQLSFKYPSVKVKLINIKKEPKRSLKHNIVGDGPTILLLKDGREIDRLKDFKGGHTLLEHLFRKAHV